MTENPPPDAPRPDEPDEPGTPSLEEPGPAAQDDYQYDAWLAAEDELHADDASQDTTDESTPDATGETADEAPAEAEEGREDVPDPLAADTEPHESVEAPAGEQGEPTWTDEPEPAVAEGEPAPDEEQPGVPGGEGAALAPEPAEPGTPDPTVAVAAAPLVDPVAPEPVEEVPVEEVPVEEPAPAAPGPEEFEAAPGTRPAQGLIAALVVVVVLLAALTGFLGWLASDTAGGGAVATARVDALKASRDAARVVFSYDYRHLQQDFAKGKALITGQFAQEYARTTGKIVDDVAGRYKAVVVADVTDAAVVRASSNQVVTLLFLTQQSQSTLSASTKITQSRLEMTMVHRHGRWLVGKIRAF